MALLDSVPCTTDADAGRPIRTADPVGGRLGDLVLLGVATVVAMVGPTGLTLFDPREDIVEYVSIFAVPLLLGWLAMLFADGQPTPATSSARDRGVQARHQGVRVQCRTGRHRLLPDRASRCRAASSSSRSSSGLRCSSWVAWPSGASSSGASPRAPQEGVVIAGNPSTSTRWRRCCAGSPGWLHRPGGADHAGNHARRDPAGIPVLGTHRPGRHGRSRRRTPTSSSSPTGRSRAPTTCAARCGTWRHCRAGHRRAEPHRRLQRAAQGAAGGRAPAGAPGVAADPCTPRTGPSGSSTSRLDGACSS